MMRVLISLLTALVAAHSLPAYAQAYPTKPIRFIIPFPPSGPTDIIGRVAASQLSSAWGVGVVPDNRGGAGGTLGAYLCAKSPPDGYTMCMMSVAQAIAPSIYPNLAFSPVKDFSHLSLLATLPSLLLVHPSMPVKTVKDLVALAKTQPGKLNYASSGSGSSSHMLMELLKVSASINLVHVPYKGTGPALIDQVSGQIEVGFAAIVAALPHVRSGRLRNLAVSVRDRFPLLPDVPTIAESGVEGFDGGSWMGVAAPAGTPRAIVDKANEEFGKIFQQAAMKEKLLALGGIPAQGSPEEFSNFVQAEVVKWAKIVKAANIKTK